MKKERERESEFFKFEEWKKKPKKNSSSFLLTLAPDAANPLLEISMSSLPESTQNPLEDLLPPLRVAERELVHASRVASLRFFWWSFGFFGLLFLFLKLLLLLLLLLLLFPVSLLKKEAKAEEEDEEETEEFSFDFFPPPFRRPKLAALW